MVTDGHGVSSMDGWLLLTAAGAGPTLWRPEPGRTPAQCRRSLVSVRPWIAAMPSFRRDLTTGQSLAAERHRDAARSMCARIFTPDREVCNH